MNLEQLSVMVRPADGDYKYLVIQLSNTDGKKVIIRYVDVGKVHKDIEVNLRTEFPDLTDGNGLSFLGGGRLHVRGEEREVGGRPLPGNTAYIHDTSGNYGPDQDPERTLSILREVFPGFNVTRR